MKQNVKFTICALLICGTTAAIASEAWTPISYGVKSLGMGGVSIANVQGAESALANPALLSFMKKNEVSIGATYTKNNADLTSTDSTSYYANTNKADTLSPYICFNYHLPKHINIGVNVTDYNLENYLKDVDNAGSLKDKLQKTRVSIPVSYMLNNFSIGATLIHEKVSYSVATTGDLSGGGSASDNNFGYELGFAYKFSDMGILVGVDYKSEIKHSFIDSSDNSTYEINSASEIGIGVSWNIMNTPHQIAVDYKRVNSSEIVKDNFGNYTQDQNVFAIGYMYNAKKWQARVGYRYVSALYTDKVDINFMLPYATTSHYTIGGSYYFSNNFSVDVAVLYATYSHSAYYNASVYNDVNSVNSIDSKPVSVSLGINYTF